MNKTVAFVFPGQGSQSVGMLDNLAQEFPQIKNWYEIASDILGYNLWELVQSGPETTLNKTIYTQPAMLVAGYCIWLLCRERKAIEPPVNFQYQTTENNQKTSAILAGHSLGEYTALVCANVLDFTDAVRLVSLRGRYMQEAIPEGQGGMAAIIGLPEDTVVEICNQVTQDKEILTPANYNSPGQIVIAGHSKAIDRAVERAQELGAKLAKRLAMSVPSHCQLMKPAAEKLASVLEEVTFKRPQFPIINNVDAEINFEPEVIKDALVRQLYNPVRWVDVILAFKKLGIATVIEAGPGRVLAGLNKRIDRSLEVHAISDVSSLNDVLSVL